MNCLDCLNLKTVKRSERPEGKVGKGLARCIKGQIFDCRGGLRVFTINRASGASKSFNKDFCKDFSSMDV